jgi:hypothetical protein
VAVRQLHVVGVSDDGDALLLGPSSSSTKPSHQLPLDDRLRSALRGQLAAPGSDRAQIALTPKEIQARMRAGETPEEVAKAAEVPVARVLPYAAPVIAERQRIVDDARGAVVHRNRGPASSRPLGDAVDAHLNDVAGLRPDTVEWSARRRRDGAWIVLLSYAARGGRRSASWLWRPLERDLSALDAMATRLAADEVTAVRRRSVATKRPAAKKPAAKKPAAKRPAARKAAKKIARKAASKAPATRKPAAKKPAAKKAVARKTAPKVVKKAATRKVVAQKTVKRAATPARRPAVRKAAAVKRAAIRKPMIPKLPLKKVPARTVVAKKATPVRRQVKAAPERPLKIVKIRPEAVEPTPVDPTPVEVVAVEQVEPVEEREQVAAAPARRAGARVPLPSWSDVLLGVQAVPHDDEDDSQSASARRRRKG